REGLHRLALLRPALTLLLQPVVEALDDLGERAGQVAVVVDVADDLLAQQHLPRGEPEQHELVAEMVCEVARLDRDRLVVLLLLVLGPPPAGLEAVEEDLLPVDLLLLLLLLLSRLLLDGLL